MNAAPELDRKSYLYRWLALTAAAGVASVGVVFATRGWRGEMLVLGVWAAWFVIKLVVLDAPRLRNLGWNERWALASVLPPIGIYLQIRLLLFEGRRLERVRANSAAASGEARANAAPAAKGAESDETAQDSDELAAVLEYYQACGFFTGETRETVAEKFRVAWERDPKFETPWDEVFLLSLDRAQTWTGDPEADVCAENKVYAKVLAEWAKITGGQFAPTNVAENWESEAGPVRVTFRVGGEEASVSPVVRDDWIDLEVLGELNFFTIGAGWKFNYAVDGNFCVVTFLPVDVERRLRAERRLPLVLG